MAHGRASSTAESTLNEMAVAALVRGFSGSVITPEAPSYEETRAVFNSMISKRPAAIALCETVEDVVRAIRFGREHQLELAVRCGGHSVAGHGLVDDGLVIDLRRMNAVTVDLANRTATVAGGATIGHLDRATAPHGLATTGGRVSTTGVGGLTLGGGDGWLARKMGLACDNLVAVQLVTADGDVVEAADTSNPELFWALHGGGGNFGVATSFTFRLHELPRVTVALLLWRPESGQDLLGSYRDFMASAPDEVGGVALFLTAPPEAFVPAHLVDGLAFAILAVYAGPEADAREVMAPLLRLKHEGALIVETPYVEFQCMLDDPPGYRNYWSVEYLDVFPDAAVQMFCSRAADLIVPSPSVHALIPQGGMIERGPTEYPIPWRRSPWGVHPAAVWQDPRDDERAKSWVHDARADLKPWASGDVYLNFIGDEGADRVKAGLGAENYARLAAIKAHYDPDNVFHVNHNIKPFVRA